MKKALFVVLTCAVLFSFTSCVTSSASTAEPEQVYESYAYSTFFGPSVAEGGSILVAYEGQDYQWNCEMESAMCAVLEENGYSCTALTSFYNAIVDMTEERLYEMLSQFDLSYMLAGMEVDVFVFVSGGGVKEFSSEWVLVDLASSQDTLAYMSVSTVCEKNEMESFYKTRRKAVQSTAEAILQELNKQ